MIDTFATIALWRRSAFIWGQTDCIMATCNHIRDNTGIDPARPWRGTYESEDGAAEIVAAHGGVLGLFRHGMAVAGFEGGAVPKAGYPVVANVLGHQIAGVCIGNRIAFMAAGRGLVEMRAEVLDAWAI